MRSANGRRVTSPKAPAVRRGPAPREYSYVLIGGGVAAATIARQLLATDRATSILIVEAGPEVPAQDRRYWWDHVIFERQPYKQYYDREGENDAIGVPWDYKGARAMVYGGSTIHWGGWSLRMKPEDFHLFTNTGEGADWPFGYDELARHYYEAEKYLAVCGDDADDPTRPKDQPYPLPPFEYTAPDEPMKVAFEVCGIQPGRMPIARYKKCMTTGTCKYCPFGSRFNAQYVIDDLRAEPRHVNLEIRTRTVATRLVTDVRKNVIEGVDLLDTVKGRSERVVGVTYVLCAGTYESAKLLLASTGPKWPAGIGNDTDLVGRHIVSHSFLRVKGTTPTNPKGWFQEYDFPTLMSRSWDTPEYQKVGKVFLFKNRVLPEVNFAKLMIAGKTRAQIDAILRGPMQMELQGFYEEKGERNNRLMLKAGKNHLGLPLMSIRFERHPEFKARTDAHLAQMKKVFDEMGYAVARTDMKVDPPGGHHATGTCRMGLNENEGVTDRNLRVFGTDNLYVCSNAAFPTCSAVNPTLTLTALALRFAEHLLEKKARARVSVTAKGVRR